jgi:DNA-damage-inducible protein D
VAQNNGIAPASSGNGGDDGDGSPFDRIRREDSAGEWWSARDMQPLMGYLRWEDFSQTVIDRAIRSAENTGTYSDQAFSAFTEKGTGGRGRQDYRLSRQAAYLVAMNGDPNKPAVAAAQVYFTEQTRKAELATSKPMSELDMARQYVEALEREQRIAKELEVAAPKAGKWDAFLATDGLIGMRETADLFGVDVRVLTAWLVEIKLFRRQVSQQGTGRNLPRKPYCDSGHFDTKVESKNGWSFTVAYVTSTGLDLIDDLWKKRPAA